MTEASPACRPDILVDLRCLQDPNYLDRGIGRHAIALLQGARRSAAVPAGARLVGLIDDALPAMAPQHRALVDAVRNDAYTGAMARPVWFVQPSPMTHDPLFVSRLLDHPAVASAAAVYDFIPLDDPDRYLAQPARRLAYHVALRWLARYRMLLPISAATARRLGEVLQIPAERIAVTGASVAPCFEAPPGGDPRPPRHVLVIGGDDARKNPLCAVRGHARTKALQAHRLPLVLTGVVGEASRQSLRAAAVAAGGCAALLVFPGPVPDAALVRLYRDALAVVSPSLAEGFSLPIAEAMASGVAAVGSDIPAHRELIAQPDLRFAADDDLALALILQRLAALPGYRAEAIAAQALSWQHFRAAAVAERFWSAIAAAAARHAPLTAPAIVLGSRPRLAVLSPLPPDRSGCADYTAATCSALGARTELHLFTETTAPLPVAGATAVLPLSALPAIAARYDRVIGVLGNSPFHFRIFELLMRHGGAAIAHDTWLLAFYRSQLGAERTRRIASAELGHPVSDEDIAGWLGGEAASQPTMMAELLARAAPLCVHSTTAAELIAARCGARPAVVPFCIYRPWPSDALRSELRRAARGRLALGERDVVIASFGFINATKRPAIAIAALAALRRSHPEASLHFVGAPEDDGAALAACAAAVGVASQVHLAGGYIAEDLYRDYLLAADLGLQLRAGFPGSLSGALMDCIAAGLPTVASLGLVAAIEAPDYVAAVPDDWGPAAIADALAKLLESGAAADRPESARRRFSEARSPSRYADRLCAVLGLGEPG